MLARQRIADPVLAQVARARHLPAEGIPPVGGGHFGGVVGEGLDQHRHVQPGPAQGVGDRGFLAEVRERDENPVDLLAVRLEQFGALARIRDAEHGAVLGVLRGQADRPDAFLFQHLEDGLAPAFAQVAGEEAAVAYDHAQRRRLLIFLHGTS